MRGVVDRVNEWETVGVFVELSYKYILYRGLRKKLKPYRDSECCRSVHIYGLRIKGIMRINCSGCDDTKSTLRGGNMSTRSQRSSAYPEKRTMKNKQFVVCLWPCSGGMFDPGLLSAIHTPSQQPTHQKHTQGSRPTGLCTAGNL